MFGFSGWIGTVDCFGDILLFVGTHIDLSVVPPPGGGDVIGASAINLGSTSALGLNGSADAACVP